MLHWIFVFLGVLAAIMAVAQFKVRNLVSALVYAAYALTFILSPWPRVLTYAACVGAFDGFAELAGFLVAGGEPDGLRLTEKGKKHFLGVNAANALIRCALLAAAWFFIGF